MYQQRNFLKDSGRTDRIGVFLKPIHVCKMLRIVLVLFYHVKLFTQKTLQGSTYEKNDPKHDDPTKSFHRIFVISVFFPFQINFWKRKYEE